MLLTDPNLQQQMHQSQMHQSQTHQAQPLQHTPLATSPATTAASIPPPPPPPPPPSLSPPSTPVTSSFPNPPPAYSPSTPHPTNLPHRTPSTAPTPTTWKPDSQHYDSNPLHGNPLFRQIQPTAWSRARNVHGMDPLLLPASFLLRQGQEEYALRLLSAGRYMGLIPTRNIAESVLMSMLLKNMREKNLFIDDLAQSHRGTQESGHSTTPCHTQTTGTSPPHPQQHPSQLQAMGQHPPTGPPTLPMRQVLAPTSTLRPSLWPHRHHP